MTERQHHTWHIVAEQDAKRPISAAPVSGAIALEEDPETVARGGGVVGGVVLR